jgi:hypothetical protein
MTAKCNCNVCSGHLEFDDADVGTKITCPHCQMETVLYVPKVTACPLTHATPPTKDAKNDMAPPPKPPVRTITVAPTKAADVKNSAVLSTLLLLALLAIGSAIVFLLHEQAQALNRLAERASAPKWDYKVVACEDDSREMQEYHQRTEKASLLDAYSEGQRYKGQFGLLKVRPDGDKSYGASEWELCAWFLEPRRDDPKLILIFKRPL